MIGGTVDYATENFGGHLLEVQSAREKLGRVEKVEEEWQKRVGREERERQRGYRT